MAENSSKSFKKSRLTDSIAEPVIFIGRVGAALFSLRHRRQIRYREILYYLDLCGAKSLPLVLLICFLMGGVIAVNGQIQLSKFGSEIFIVDMVGYSVLKEFGPLMVAMIATGQAASAFASEIGTMKVNEEINALITLGIAPAEYLVLPKLLAMLITLPLLTIFGDFAGLAGGLAIGVTTAGIPSAAYIERSINILSAMTMLLGVLKSVVFAVLITLAGCYCGFRASTDAQGVGRAATSAVVLSILLVVVSTAVLTILYSFIGY